MDDSGNTAGNSALESAIREKAERARQEIARQEAQETAKLNDSHAAELEQFRKNAQSRTGERIARETTRVKSRAGLQVRKDKLKRFEEFVTRTVEEVAKGIRDNAGYKKFLLDAVRDAADRIQAGAEIRVKSEDLAFEKDIRAVLQEKGAGDAAVIGDEKIKWGGCIIIDKSGGRVFDGTVERVCYRKSPEIRREAKKLLGNDKK